MSAGSDLGVGLALTACSLALLGCSSNELPRGAVLFEIATPPGSLTPEVANAGDVDRDGFDDIVVGSVAPFSEAGEVSARVHSPKTRRLLLELLTHETHAGQTAGVAGAGDTNGDGWLDVLVSEADYERKVVGRVWLFSGRDGSVLGRWSGEDPLDDFGAFACGVGDLDNDGAAEVLIGASQTRFVSFESEKATNVGPGFATVYSAKSREPLFTVKGVAPGHAFGGSACGLGDVDGDGHADLAIGSFWTSDLACALIVSGVDGHTLRKLEPPKSARRDEVTVARVPDRNGDGLDECALSYHDGSLVISPSDGRELFALSSLPMSPTWIGDFDRDGFNDAVTCDFATRPTMIDEDAGTEARLWSGRTGKQFSSAFFNDVLITGDLSPIGDIDGDRVPDFLQRVRVLSGARLFR